MKKFLIIASLIVLVFSCQKKEIKGINNKDNKKDSTSCSKEKKFEMYQASEMATLMEQMYAYNLQLKSRIIKGDTIGKFPKFFNKIYTAKFTTPSDNDAFFQKNAKKYIDAQKLIYDDPENVKKHFNDGATACITCHQGKCGGPIPRIKKLYIQ